MQVFFDDPVPKEGFTIRWISKQLELAPTSVKLHLDKLSREGIPGYPLVTRSRGISYPVYWSNRNSELFRFYKKMDMLFRLEESGALEHISEQCSPDNIVLFGSASRGEDVKGSDVDLFVESDEKKMNMEKYEAVLKRNISTHFSTSINRFPKELRNNIINGIVMRGYLKVL